MTDAADLPTRSSEEVLVGYVEAALAEIEDGREPDLDRICAGNPGLIEAVRESIGLDMTMPRPQPTAPLVGRVLLERYVLGDCIGLGAMGAVHAARDRKLDRAVAVKVMHAGLFPDESRQVRFVREAKVLAALQAPTVVPIHDQGQTEDGLFFLVMDLLDGVSLASVLRFAAEAVDAGEWHEHFGITPTERTLLRQIVAWAEQIARGLAIAHAAGVIHRDVKPSNVFITSDGRAVLLDFGIAARAEDASLTAADSALGTPWYMAPEQATATNTVQPAVDVYGLGATLYHLITKQPPYLGDPAEVIYQLRTQDPENPLTIDPTLPRDLCAIVEKALDRAPARRYRSMEGFAADLGAFLDNRPVAARPLTRLGRFVRRVRRRPARAIATAAVLILLPLVALTWWLLHIQAQARLDSEYEALVVTVPALVCLESYPDKRFAEDLLESGRAVDLLSRILELKSTDVTARMMRAALCLDRGERDRAVADFREIHAQAQTPYTEAVLGAYEHADDSVQGAAAVDLSGLPEPATRVDWLIAGFHGLRLRNDYPKTHEYLARADSLQARDLRLISGLMLALMEKNAARQRERFREVRDEALTLEGVYGRATARTRHAVGAALIGLKQYARAIEPLEDSLRLRPERHGPLHNLGVAWRRLGDLAKAEDYLARANQLRPWLWNTLYTLSQVRCDEGKFAAAMAFAERIPRTGSLGEVWQRPLLMGRVHLNDAFYRLRQGKGEDARAPARAAVPHLELAVANKCAKPQVVRAEIALAKSIAAGEMDAFGYINLWLGDFTNTVMIQNLERLLAARETLDSDTLFALRVYLLRLASDLAPDDPAPRLRRREMFDKGK